MNPLQQSGDVESNPGPPKVAKVSNNKSARAMVHLNGHGDQNGHEEVAVDQDGVRSVLEKQAELINQQKEDIVELSDDNDEGRQHHPDGRFLTLQVAEGNSGVL